MEHIEPVAVHLRALLGLFASHVTDRSTLTELLGMVEDPESWDRAHALFQRIRAKTLQADRSKNRLLGYQYAFEELCAKTLFNMVDRDAPFDPDSPYWVIPSAIALARALGIPDAEVVNVVAA